MSKPIPWYMLPIIVIAQFCCTSLWFAGNGIIDQLTQNFSLSASALGDLTAAVQFGFIVGTLIFAFLTIADRFAPSKVFFASAVIAAIINLGVTWPGNSYWTLMGLRFGTGFFLAGIYPVGMKIAADYFEKGLGKSLGFLVGALVLGTSFPHLLNAIGEQFDWKTVLRTTSILALIGGCLVMFLVPNGPFRKPSQQVDLTAFFKVFKKPTFRAAAFGYFGHMWELYTFWAFVPIILQQYLTVYPAAISSVSWWAFLIIGIGGLGCVIAGLCAQSYGPRRIAMLALLISGSCCLLSPFILGLANTGLFLAALLIWGLAVVADSPLLSTLVANNAESEIKGTALTIVNSIGFAITILSIQLINTIQIDWSPHLIYLWLAPGPVFGLIALSNAQE